KGLDTFRILDERTVAYLDLTGSGAETIAHLRENGRITLMFCALAGPPRIVRLYGRGEALLVDSPAGAALAEMFPAVPGSRAVIRVRWGRIAGSCGMAVPLFEYVGQRDELVDWAARKGPQELAEYRQRKNLASIDGLPAIAAE